MPARPGTTEQGFTLIEAMVAMAILALVITHFLGTRTAALIDAAEARNWRIAREIAEQYLSELEAGAREVRPQSGVPIDVEDYPGFSYRIVIGEAAIADAEGEIADSADAAAPEGMTPSDRLAWQHERDMLRRAQASGVTMMDYEDQQRDKELEEQIPSEDDFEEVAIFVTFPNVRPSDEPGKESLTFTMKSRICTMALEGLTPEKAEIIAEQRGAADGAASANNGGAGGSGAAGAASPFAGAKR